MPGLHTLAHAVLELIGGDPHRQGLQQARMRRAQLPNTQGPQTAAQRTGHSRRHARTLDLSLRLYYGEAVY